MAILADVLDRRVVGALISGRFETLKVGCAVIVVSALACGCGGGEAELDAVLRTTTGDTTWVQIPDPGMAAPVAVVELLWRDESLSRPDQLVLEGDRFYIGDQAQVHVVSTAGGHVTTFGRAGEGPGEFGSINGMGWVDEGLLVFDGRNARFSRFDGDGVLLGTDPSRRVPGHPSPDWNRHPLRAWAGGVLRVSMSNVNFDTGVTTVVQWESVGEDSTYVVDEWGDTRWMEAGGMIGPVEAFPPRTLLAIRADGRMGFSDGLEPCVSQWDLGSDAVVLSCLARPRSPVTPGMRETSIEGIDVEERFRDMLAGLVRDQTVADHVPSFDELRWGEGGGLWVRTLGDDAPDVHPTLLSYHPEAAPSTRLWESFDVEGELSTRVRLPSNFMPKLFVGGSAYGFLELPTGELALARAGLPG